MSSRFTPALALSTLAILALGATAALACDGNKTAKASACAPKATATVTAAKAKAAPAAATTKSAVATRKATPAAPAAKAPAASGMKAYFDPETGLITSTPGFETTGLTDALVEFPVILVEEPLPGRGYTMDLKGTLQEFSVLQLDAQGGRHFGCAKDPRALLKRTPTPLAPAYPLE